MEHINKQALHERYDFLNPAVRLLGEHAIKLFDTRAITMELKPDGSKVTTADIALNDLFIDLMALRFPQDLVWGEEGSNITAGNFGAPDDLEAAALRWMWRIDPIDGTSGFWRAYQNNNRSDCTSAVMVTGFAPGETTPTLAAVHTPFQRYEYTVLSSQDTGSQYYTARADQPRRLTLPNKGPVSLDQAERFEENYWNGSQPDLRVMADMMPFARKVRTSSVGAAMSRLAMGDIDIVAFPGPANPHDVAPGALIAHQAGAVVTDLKGQPYSEIDWRVGPLHGCLGAVNQQLADDFVGKLAA